MSKQLVFFGEDWGGLPSSSQHFARHLANNGWEIVWVNSIGLREPALRLRDLSRLIKKIFSFFCNKKQQKNKLVPANINILSPLIIPFIGYTLVDSINRRLFARQIKRKLATDKLDHAIFITALPTAVAFYPLWQQNSWFYYCCDDFSGLANVSNEKVIHCENKLLPLVEQVIVSSKTLAQKLSNYNPVTIEHGVDVELFSMQKPRPNDLPQDKPIVGYYGSISQWLDLDLIAYCAANNQHFNFVFIGNSEVDTADLKALDNVYFLGPKPHQELSAYLQYWQVAILPFKDNKQIHSCNPLKLREYLASGCFVVSTNFPVAKQFAKYLCVTESKQQFSQNLIGYQQDTFDKKQARIDCVSEQSWRNQTRKLEQILLAKGGDTNNTVDAADKNAESSKCLHSETIKEKL